MMSMKEIKRGNSLWIRCIYTLKRVFLFRRLFFLRLQLISYKIAIFFFFFFFKKKTRTFFCHVAGGTFTRLYLVARQDLE
jgi:hypothetical protein